MTATTRTRWTLRRDLPAVAALDAAEHAEPWGVKDYTAAIRPRNHIGMTAEEDDGTVIGAAVYELRGGSLRLVRACGERTALLARLEQKLAQHRREYLAMPTAAGDLRWPAAVPTEYRTADVGGLVAVSAPGPILADALQDAGCDHGPLLAALRGTPGLAQAVAARLLAAGVPGEFPHPTRQAGWVPLTPPGERA